MAKLSDSVQLFFFSNVFILDRGLVKIVVVD